MIVDLPEVDLTSFTFTAQSEQNELLNLNTVQLEMLFSLNTSQRKIVLSISHSPI